MKKATILVIMALFVIIARANTDETANDASKAKSELVIMITPKIINDGEDTIVETL